MKMHCYKNVKTVFNFFPCQVPQLKTDKIFIMNLQNKFQNVFLHQSYLGTFELSKQKSFENFLHNFDGKIFKHC